MVFGKKCESCVPLVKTPPNQLMQYSFLLCSRLILKTTETGFQLPWKTASQPRRRCCPGATATRSTNAGNLNLREQIPQPSLSKCGRGTVPRAFFIHQRKQATSFFARKKLEVFEQIINVPLHLHKNHAKFSHYLLVIDPLVRKHLFFGKQPVFLGKNVQNKFVD